MILKTKDFQQSCTTILTATALDKAASNLELLAKDNKLRLNVTNQEYYVSVLFDLEENIDFRAVVDAPLFLNLISSITADTFELNIKDNTIIVKVGKSQYKLPMIYENANLITLQPISINNVTVEMPIHIDILNSILNVNSKELLKVKNLDVNELQRLYYIDETGCFTFTTGACLNSFTLEKPVKMLLNDRIVKLFKLFKDVEDSVSFSLGYDVTGNGTIQSKVIFETSNIYVAAYITNDDILLSKVQRPCELTKGYIKTDYVNKVVFSVAQLSSAINRLLMFTKNSAFKANMLVQLAKFSFINSELTIMDKEGNTEVLQITPESYIDNSYDMLLNLADLKLVLDSCKDQHITMNFGNHNSVVLTRGPISNLIPEGRPMGNN